MSLSEIRLIAADVDGTLLNSRKELTENVINAIMAVQECGVQFTIATGRGIRGLRGLRSLLSPGVPVITYNGAELRKEGTEELMCSTCLSEEASAGVISQGLSRGFSVIVWSRGELFIGQPGPASFGYSKMYGISELPLTHAEKLSERGVTKVIWAGEREEIRRMEQLYTDRPIRGTVCCTSEASYLEFMAKGVDKGSGLRAAAEILGLHREQVMAVGDGHNDLPMLRWAGWSVAMGNAAEDVRRETDAVTKTCDEDGLAFAIQQVCEAQARR